MTNLPTKGLTVSCIVLSEGANFGEGMGNISYLKKIAREDGEKYPYISRQAIRYSLAKGMKVDNTKLTLDGTVIQFHPDATIEDYPEIDLFGYMKTASKYSKTRAGVVRVSNAFSLSPFMGDLDFLTNKGLLERYNDQSEDKKSGSNISQTEIHKSYYSLTVTVDLDKVGIDKNDDIEIPNEEKHKRVKLLLDSLKLLKRDIRGRRENLNPIFLVGGVYDKKNPFFDNRLQMNKNELKINLLKNTIYEIDDHISKHTRVGYLGDFFDNDKEIKEELNPLSIKAFFEHLEKEVSDYYINR